MVELLALYANWFSEVVVCTKSMTRSSKTLDRQCTRLIGRKFAGSLWLLRGSLSIGLTLAVASSVGI